jgi:quinohemoprotein ethanol dehydrogenase
MDHLRPRLRRDALQPAETDRREQCKPAWTGVDVGERIALRRPRGIDSACVQRRALRILGLGRALCGGRRQREVRVAVGSGDSPPAYFRTLLRPGESRRRALAMAGRTWTGEWWKMGGGGTVWDAMAYDACADILYAGTGNGGPWDRNVRSPQGGGNLFLGSVLGVKPDNGRMVWYFQETPGEDGDYTSVQPIILADLTINGKQRKVLLHAPKNGFFCRPAGSRMRV